MNKFSQGRITFRTILAQYTFYIKHQYFSKHTFEMKSIMENIVIVQIILNYITKEICIKKTDFMIFYLAVGLRVSLLVC